MDSSNQQPQEDCINAQPTAQHEWLSQLVGEWDYESEMQTGPGQPPMKMSGHESVRTLGGLWTIGEMEGEMPDGDKGLMIITLGYDTAKGRFVGTFIGSMMTHLWVYDGELDADRRVLTLSAEGPDMSPGAEPGKLAQYHDIIELVDADHRILRSQALGPDGQWHEFMVGHYRRKHTVRRG